MESRRKVLLIAKEDYFGAGKAALRIYQVLKEGGHEICFLVQHKTLENEEGIIKYEHLVPLSFLGRVLQFVRKNIKALFEKTIITHPDYYFFGINDRNLRIKEKKLVKKLAFIPDTIIFTWTSQFLNARSLSKLQKLTGANLFAYPMDMSLFTGGCHYSWNCDGYKYECRECPAILDTKNKDIAHKNWKQKQEYYKCSGTKIIAASSEQLYQLKASSLFKAQTLIPKLLLPINERCFNSRNRVHARSSFGWKHDEKIIFFGATFTNEKRKGVSLFIETLKLLGEIYATHNKNTDLLLIVIAGSIPRGLNFNEGIPFKIHFSGYINDDAKLSLLYQSACVFVCTSLQDAGPMMVNESIMCGTPVVAFEIGVVKDLVFDGISGYKIALGDVKMMAQRIFSILELTNEEFDRMVFSTSEIGLKNTSTSAFRDSFNKQN